MTTAAAAGPDRAGVVIPVRSFRDAKRRLGSVLDPGKRGCVCLDCSDRATSASPTDTAWIQMDSSPSTLRVMGRNPSR